MAKTILVCGYGPGVSRAVAERFGAEGFATALVARSADKLDAGVTALASKGITAAAFPADLGDPSAIAPLVGRARDALGPITVIHWNADSHLAGDLLAADTATIRGALDIGVTSLIATVQAALPDLRKSDASAVLVTNGGFGKIDPQMDAIGVQVNAMGLAVASAAKDKLVGLLAVKLKGEGIYVGQVTVFGMVKGTAWAQELTGVRIPTIDPRTVAERFWSLYRRRSDVRAEVVMQGAA